MKNVYRSVLTAILSMSVISPVLSSMDPQLEQGGRGSVHATKPEELLKPIEELQRRGVKDLQGTVMHHIIGNVNELHKKDEQLYRLGLVNKENWGRYEQIAFNPVDVKKFAEQAVNPEYRDKISEKEVIEYFGLDTTVGRMKFRKMI